MNETTQSEIKVKPRAIMLSDVTPMVNILKKIGVKEFRSIYTSEEIKAAQAEEAEAIAGFAIAEILLENYPKCEKEIASFLGSFTGKTCEEMLQTPLNEVVELIVEVVQGSGFAGFIKVVSKSFK